MRVLHIITGLDNGGAEGALYRLATSIKIEQAVVSLTDGGIYGRPLMNAGILVHTLDMPRARLKWRAAISLYRLLRQIRPDIVQTWMYHADLVGGVVARCAGVPAVVWGIRGPFNQERTSLSTKITIYLCALLSRWIPKAIISNSNHARAVHVRAGYSGSKFVKIPNGFSLDRFRPDKAAGVRFREALGVRPGTALLGMVARFDSYKDHENLLRALRILSSQGSRITCLLVGSGMVHGNAQLEELIRKHEVGDAVKLIGPRTDVPDVMAALDVHVLSSAAESFPNVLAEAMACGTPCITTDVGDAAEIVGDTGWVVPHSDHAALARAIHGALAEMKNSESWSRRKTLCRQRIVENYSLERMAQSYIEVWAGAINDKRGGHSAYAGR